MMSKKERRVITMSTTKERFFVKAVALSVIIICLSIVKSNDTTASSIKRGGILKYGLSSEPPNLDPHKATGTGAQVVKNIIYNGLVRYWKGYEIVPDLAKSWDTSADGRQYTFYLHQGVKWHNGEKFTAQDVKYSLERIQNPATGAVMYRELSELIDEVVVLNDTTVRFVLKHPSLAFLPILAEAHVKIVSKSYVEKGGNLVKDPMGTGPFKFAEMVPTVHLKIVKNKEYFKKGLPYLDGINLYYYPDETSRVTALRTGALDFIEYVPWRQIPAVERDPKLRLQSDKEMMVMVAIINTKRPPLDKPKVREALAWAINRQAIVDNVFFGRGEVIGGIGYPKSWEGYCPDLSKTYTYNPEKAKKLLLEAGFPKGFKLSILASFTFGMHKDTAEILQANFTDVGIDAKCDLVDYTTLTKRRFVSKPGDYDMMIMGIMHYYRDPSCVNTWFGTDSFYGSQTGLSDKEIDSLLEKGSVTMDSKKRIEIYCQVQKRALELNPILSLCFREQAEGAQVYVKGYGHIPGVFDSSNTLEVTWLDK
jgi:ABC-type transport system substrate-binding protein